MASKKTHEEFIAEMAIVNPNIEIIGTYTKSTERIKCKLDGYEWNPIAAELLRGRGCSVCSRKKWVQGYTDIPSVAPWMVDYFQGGYDEAKMYTVSSTQKIKPMCPICGRIKKVKL